MEVYGKRSTPVSVFRFRSIEPLVSDGFFLMLAPLPVGLHTIHFQAIRTRPNGTTFEVEVTYHLTVVPGAKEPPGAKEK